NVDAVPVFVAADGPLTQRMAGRVGDGAIVGNGATPEIVRHALDNIRAGRVEAGKDPDDFDVWWMVRVHIAESEAAAYRDLRGYMATYANTRYREKVSEKGLQLDEDLAERVRGLRREFRYDLSLGTDTAFNAELV